MDGLQKQWKYLRLRVSNKLSVSGSTFDKFIMDLFPKVRMITTDVGIRPSYLTISMISFFWGLYLVGLVFAVVSKFLVLLIPAYKAYKQLRRSSPDAPLLSFWLKYFLLYVLWESMEAMFSKVYDLGMIYTVLKVIFLVVMYQPRTGALERVFQQLVQWLQPHEKKLDHNLSVLSAYGTKLDQNLNAFGTNVVDGLEK